MYYFSLINNSEKWSSRKHESRDEHVLRIQMTERIPQFLHTNERIPRFKNIWSNQNNRRANNNWCDWCLHLQWISKVMGHSRIVIKQHLYRDSSYTKIIKMV